MHGKTFVFFSVNKKGTEMVAVDQNNNFFIYEKERCAFALIDGKVVGDSMPFNRNCWDTFERVFIKNLPAFQKKNSIILLENGKRSYSKYITKRFPFLNTEECIINIEMIELLSEMPINKKETIGQRFDTLMANIVQFGNMTKLINVERFRVIDINQYLKRGE